MLQPDAMPDPATDIDLSTDFARHVAVGLRAQQAFLSSRFIYDARGSRLFQDIMALEEYYLTRAEFAILRAHAREIAAALADDTGRPLELVELGAGDGTKTKLLLRALLAAGVEFRYRPVDISADILDELGADLRANLPGLTVDPILGSYAAVLADLAPDPTVKRAMVFLGSNIGNFSLAQAGRFVAELARPLRRGDMVLLGADLRKDPRLILRAYDDGAGVTAAFNLNLLHRLRDELGAELDPDGWGFYPTYNPETGEVRSYLYPRGAQRIRVPALGIDRTFGPHEVIHSEISRKYSLGELEVLAKAVGARQVGAYFDAERRFCDALWRVDAGES